MWLISKVGVRQIVKWKESVLFNKAKYHSGLGVFGHRPRTVDEAETPQEVLVRRYENSRASALVEAYRKYGHLKASIDNVDFRNVERTAKELNIDRYGLKTQDTVDLGLLYGYSGHKSIGDLVQELERIYCGHISYEFSHLETETEREWFAQRVEGQPDIIDIERRREIAAELLRGQTWEKFVAVKLPAVKRFSGEGADSLLTVFSTLFRLTTAENIEYFTLAMPHRGKLSAMATLLKCPPVKLFHKFSGQMEFPEDMGATCDIALHFSLSSDITVNDKKMRVSMVNNPSHLEIANPVSMGKARSKQLQILEGDYSPDGSSRMGDKVFNVQFHGDAAFAGQGVNQESLMLSQAPHFDIGGTFHVVVNNQVGFTLPSDRRGSSRYVTDVAKMIAAPVIHVNADYPELVAKATKIAFEYRQKFRKDVFIDYNCYRRWGHNEMDEPTFTSPLLYKLIRSRKSITDLYTEKLVAEGVLQENDVKNVVGEFTNFLQKELDAAATYKPEVSYFQDQWSKMVPAPKAVEIWDTGFDTEQLKAIGIASVTLPSSFNLHSHLSKTHVKNRLKKIAEGESLDWSTAEALAFGSLLLEGRHVRISGEDVGRGTFSHRHVMLVDQQNNEIYIPLNNIKEDQKAFLEVANSILSEEAVLAYEYGMAYDSPENLIVWEAQFGDFFNGAQMVFDTYISSGESKWVRSNGLVVLLPHGYDGAASDHSSCRMERFLQMTDSSETAPDSDAINMQVVYPTTPAQYFHLLRRQMVRNYRKPLIVVSPKLMLRQAEVISSLAEFAPGTHFHPVIGDYLADPLSVKRIILVSGKHFYELHRERYNAKIEDVAIIRVESLCPFPLQDLQREIEKYPNTRKIIWSQEEHRNMGAWAFIKPRFENLLGRQILYAGRAELAVTSVGSKILHQAEVQHVLREPLYNMK